MLFIGCTLFTSVYAQDSVDVYFTYKTNSNPTNVFLPGEFNNWANNSGGVISPNPKWNMAFDNTNHIWYKTVRLAVGGAPTGGVHGAYQYKFNENGCSSCWTNDPVNQHVNAADNGNSFVYIKDPTILHLLPNQRNPIVNTSFPAITAYIFPKVGSTVDTSTLRVSIDGIVTSGLGYLYNFTTNAFAFTPPSPLPNGSHTVILSAGTNADTVTFTTHGGFVQIQNEYPFTTWKPSWTLNGIVNDSSVTVASIVRNGVDTFSIPVSHTQFSAAIPLVEGVNTFVAIADSQGVPRSSSAVNYTRRVNHNPSALIMVEDTTGGNIALSASSSTDPDSNQSASLTFLWSVDPANPSAVGGGVNGSTAAQVTFATPSVPGEYYFGLIATDPNGNKDTTRNYVVINADHSVTIPEIQNNPEWAKEARIYFLFPKAASSAGTINGAAALLPYIKQMGFSVVWLMPIMKNAYPIDNGSGPGYNIVDFYNVAPEYGTNQDFANFMTQAHSLGLHVILDITPNHSSRFHPWSADAHTFGTNSPYWGWYEHQEITANTNGLGDCLDANSFNYYCGFSDQLLNLNWKDVDMQTEMINTYKYWIEKYGVDGFRFDVYWGPHRRYGEQYMGMPVRNALKHIKPDILLLAEDDGTGAGTEAIYADYSNGGISGGVDASYDFNLYFNAIENFGFTNAQIQNLNTDINNGGFYPGVDALYMRFMESQDQDRIVYFYSNNFAIDATTTFMRTMPMASVLFTIPGVPMVWNGQEVGFGYGIGGAKEARDRSLINWNYQGKTLLSPHYQKLASIRAQFPAFTQHKQDTNGDGQVNASDASDFTGVTCTNPIMYAFARPYDDQNGLTVVNFSGSEQTAYLNFLSGSGLKFTGGVQPGSTYYLNNLYANTHQQIAGSSLDSVYIDLTAYGSGIYTVSTTRDSVTITDPILSVPDRGPKELPRELSLYQNFPNPFNPSTVIRFDVPNRSFVTIKIYDVIGRELATLAAGEYVPGNYAVTWNAGNLPSGVYFYRLTTSSGRLVKKMLLVR